MSEDGKFIAMIVVIVAIIVAFFAILSDQTNACEDKGGHMVQIYKSQICVSEDGRILE